MIALFLWTFNALAADCNPSAQQLAEWAQRGKTGVVWDSPKGLRTSGMDEAEIRAAAGSNTCLKEALELTKQKPWLKDPSLQESLRYFYCQKISSAAVVPHVNYKGTVTAFVRINLANEEGGKEIAEGGRMEEGQCREIFLKQIRENTLAVVQKMKARKPAVANVPQVVKAGLAAVNGPKAPAPESPKAILQGLQKKASSNAPGALETAPDVESGARRAD